MFEVSNIFWKESLDCIKTGKNLGDRYDEIEHLQEICDYCAYNDEKLECNMEDMYYTQVEPGVNFCDWLYLNEGEAGHDLRTLMMYMTQYFTDLCECKDGKIDISLGQYSECVYDKKTYRERRRELLEKISHVDDFCDFMKTCFIDSEFSNLIRHTLKRSSYFPSYAKEIIENLSLLNDEAVSIYEECAENEKEAMKVLSSKAKGCSKDPLHKNQLKFPFTCQTEADGKMITYIAEIMCEPHLKLVRKDSNLRIYFYWRDARIQDGKKILIGSIGGHPY